MHVSITVGRRVKHAPGTFPALTRYRSKHTRKERNTMAGQEPEYVETSALIASDQVEGTTVEQGEKFGKILNFMVNKHNGQVEYAVMSFGGFLGMGEDHYPLPWKKLNYDTELQGFVVDIDQPMLDKAPRHDAGKEPVWDASYGTMVNSYYGIVW
jgi:hypothetical protein